VKPCHKLEKSERPKKGCASAKQQSNWWKDKSIKIIYQDSYVEDGGVNPVKYFTQKKNFVQMLPASATKVNLFV